MGTYEEVRRESRGRRSEGRGRGRRETEGKVKGSEGKEGERESITRHLISSISEGGRVRVDWAWCGREGKKNGC